MKNDSYSIPARLGLYFFQICLKLYRRFNEEGCSTYCEKCLSYLISIPVDIENISKIEKISFMKKILQRYILPTSSFKNL